MYLLLLLTYSWSFCRALCRLLAVGVLGLEELLIGGPGDKLGGEGLSVLVAANDERDTFPVCVELSVL